MTVLPTSSDQKHKALSEHWIGRYLVEKKVDRAFGDIDGVDFSIWLQSREKPSNGQKRNISTAIRKHFGIKLLAICSLPREVSDRVVPCRDTFEKTISELRNMHEIKKLEDCDDYFSEYEVAYFAFVSTSITGLSIAELTRSKIFNKRTVYQNPYDSSVKNYDLAVIVDNSADCKNQEIFNTTIYLMNLTEEYLHCINDLQNLLKLDSEYSFSQRVSKLQHIIRQHNQAKGYNLRSLRSMYPGILGFLKSED